MELFRFLRLIAFTLSFLILTKGVCSIFISDSTSVDSTSRIDTNKSLLKSFESLNKYIEIDDSFEYDILSVEAYEDSTISESIAKWRSRALAVFEEVRNARKFVDYLDEQSLLELPVGINKTVGNIDYTILVDSITLRPDGAYLTAYMMFTLPSNGRSIAFRGSGIKFSSKGGIQPEDGKLQLLGDYPIPFNDKTLLILKGDGETSVSFDCDGFNDLSISADILFSRDFIVPDTPDGSQGTDRVKTSFKTSLTDWNDFLVELTIPDFQVRGVDGLGFTVNNAVFDYSDYRNSTSVSFPANYLSEIGLTENVETWRGFYMRDLSVRLPGHFKKLDEDTRTSFSARNMIIDRSGFTGLIEAENLINIDEGDLDGWAYSLSKIHLEFQANQLLSGGFEGELVIPVTKESKTFDYTALISNNNEYEFRVEANDTINFPLFKTSEVELFPNSTVEVVVSDGDFLPKANLYGWMDIRTGDKGLKLADIQFENLQIQTVGPYLTADYFSFGSEAAQQYLSGFPVQIKDIGFRNVSDTETALDFDLSVNVTENFSGEAGVVITGKQVKEKRTSWRFHKFKVDEIALDVKTGAFDMNGRLVFYKNDAVYGDGFNGQIQATIHSLSLTVESTAIFGVVDRHRYWYFDAGVKLPTGITIVPGVDITGFAGGAYKGMAIDMSGGSELGETRSGIIYAPNTNAGLGLKASISFASTGSKSSYNGEAGFEIAFFKGGGVRYISFKGNIYFMTPPMEEDLNSIKEKAKKIGDAVAKMEKAAGNIPGSGLIAENKEEDQTLTQIYGQIGDAAGKQGQISAHAFVELDFENNSLYGLFEAYINVAGGIIKGVGPGGRAGWVEFYFAPGEWYIYIGTPTDRIGVSAGIGPLRASLTSYFMMGTSIPGSPPPPDEVSEILGGMDLDYMKDLNALGNGAGIGFGAAFAVDTGDLRFLMFYARFRAGAGFDVMLKDYGDAICVGRGPLGVNGWYANGQAYAYFDGEIGIRVKIFGRRKNIEILSIGAAAVLQAKLPNPFWMRGVVGGRFRVLGGLVKGNCKFEITLGDECKIQQDGSILETIQVIADVSPKDGDSDVSVFATPQAVFNLAVDEVFEMVDYDEKLKKFRAKMDFFRVKDGTRILLGSRELNFDKNVCVFDAHDIFPPQRKLEVEVQVSFEEYRNGRWQAVIVDGKKYSEYMSAGFKSGDAPDFIPLDNVAYSYPMINQLNFYKHEYFSGYIVLKRGQPYLFNATSEWNQRGRMVNVQSGKQHYFDYQYSTGNKEVAFNLPREMIEDQIFKFELVNLPAKSSGSLDRNIKTDSTRTIGDGSAKVVARKAEGSISQLQEKAIFETAFRTSKYTTFKNKINAQTITRTSREIAFLWEGLYLNNDISLSEAYSREELIGNQYTQQKPTVRLAADLSGNQYFENAINPLIYDGYPVGGARITNRDVDSLGVVPTRAIKIRQNDYNLTLEPSHIQTGNFIFPEQSPRILYLLAPYMYFDFIDLQAQVAQKYLNQTSVPARIDKLLWGQFPIHSPGTYKIKAAYYLPGKKRPNSEVLINTVYTQE